MILLFFCVVINALIAVIFKYYEKFGVNVFQAIVVNYFVCVITGIIVLGENPLGTSLLYEPWIPYAFILSTAFIVTFTLMALTVQGFGIVIATIFQKMSLIAPTLMGILIYNEGAGIIKILGIVLAVASIFIITRIDQANISPSKHSKWIYPIIVFLGSCVIDFTFYYVNIHEIVDSGDIRFVIALFLFAGLIGITILSFQIITGKSKFEMKSIIGGICLGVPNLFSIYLLLLVLDQGMDGSVVFPINNVGILAMSAIFGVILFREKLGPLKSAGLLLAIVSILLIANG